MKEISELLKKKDIRALSYKKNGNAVIANTNIGKVVIKKNNHKEYIYNYLNTRSFNYYPQRLNSYNDNHVTINFGDNQAFVIIKPNIYSVIPEVRF